MKLLVTFLLAERNFVDVSLVSDEIPYRKELGFSRTVNLQSHNNNVL